jgi:putative oxidoreductase
MKETLMATVDTALLILRIVLGLLMIGHAMQKLTGAFGGDGFAKMAAVLDTLGFKPGRLTVAMAIGAERDRGEPGRLLGGGEHLR